MHLLVTLHSGREGEILTKKKETKSPDHPEGNIKLINSDQHNKQRSNIFHETIE
jgi:hypothetical protein